MNITPFIMVMYLSVLHFVGETHERSRLNVGVPLDHLNLKRSHGWSYASSLGAWPSSTNFTGIQEWKIIAV